MKKYRLKTTWGVYPVICFTGTKIGNAYDITQKKLRDKKKRHIYHELTLYKTKHNIVWEVTLRSSKRSEDGHCFVGFSSSSREIAISLKEFNVLYGVKLPKLSDIDYEKKKKHKLHFLTNNYNKTRSKCLSKIRFLDFHLE